MTYLGDSMLTRLGQFTAKLTMLFTLASLAGSSLETEAKAPIRLARHLVALEVQDTDGVWKFQGSGTLVKMQDQLTVVTALHVVDTDLPMRVCASYERTACVDVKEYAQSLDLNADLAFIPVEEQVVLPTRLGPSLLTGERGFTVALPRDMLAVVEAQVIGPQGSGRHRMLGWCDYGSSGGGVFDDRGRLVGVITSFMQQPMTTMMGDLGLAPANSICIVETIR